MSTINFQDATIGLSVAAGALLIALIVVSVLFANETKTSNIKLISGMSLDAGFTSTLTSPEPNTIWSVKDPSIATVSPVFGNVTVVTGLKPGVTTVIAKSTGRKKGSTVITVNAAPAFSLSPSSGVIAVSGQLSISSSLPVTWSVSSDVLKIISYTETSVVLQAQSEGSATVTATAVVSKAQVSAKITVISGPTSRFS